MVLEYQFSYMVTHSTEVPIDTEDAICYNVHMKQKNPYKKPSRDKNSRFTPQKNAFAERTVRIDVLLTRLSDGTFTSNFNITSPDIVNNKHFWKIDRKQYHDIKSIFFHGVYRCLEKTNQKFRYYKTVINFYIQLCYIINDDDKFLFANAKEYQDRLDTLKTPKHKIFFHYLKPIEKRSEEEEAQITA